MNPIHEHIRALLARYDAVETTLAEERELRRLLAEPTHAAVFPEAAALFGAWSVLAQAAPPPAEEAPWLRDAEAAPDHTEARRHTTTRGTPLASVSPGKGPEHAPGGRPALSPGGPHHLRRPRTLRRARRLYAAAVAAAVALLITAALALFLRAPTHDTPVLAEATPTPTAIDWSRYEITDPDEAGRITQRALANVSTRLRRGSRIASREVGRIETIHHATTTH